jgi:hypothetical protein
MPTDVGEEVRSVGVEGTRDELRIVGTTGTTRGTVAVVGDGTGRAQASAVSATAIARMLKSRVVFIYEGAGRSRRTLLLFKITPCSDARSRGRF